MKKNILNYILIFLVISLGLQLLMGKQNPVENTPTDQPITLKTTQKDYNIGKVLELNVTNNTSDKIRFKSTCPVQPFTIIETTNNKNLVKTSKPSIDCTDKNDSNIQDIILKPNATTKIRYTYWTNDLMPTTGEYKVGAKFKLKDKSYEIYSNTFEVVERGFFSNIWLIFLYQPIYNFLIWLVSLTPGYSLGVGIILLTILVRLVLYIPNKKALLAQKRLSEVQPKLNIIKEKYKDNQQKMAEETMKIWKEHKVNPVSSCLPVLIQFPLLIALFYVIQDGLNPDKTWLLYNMVSQFDFTAIQSTFLGFLNLKEKNIILLPLIVGALQFIQLKIAMTKKPASTDKNDPNAMMQGIMLYLMPAMIAIFTASMPAGVGLYWGTSTLFGIIQQYLANIQVEKELNSIKKNKDVRVIDIK